MFSRRQFVTTSSCAIALSWRPPVLEAAEPKPFDPTPQIVKIKKQEDIGQILVVPRSFYLYLVVKPRRAIRYGVGVGKAGLEFTGSAIIERKREWPSWRPTPEMIKRDPRAYSKFVDNEYIQPGGPENPLGARALYLYQNGVDTYFRIHGTNRPETIGSAVSNGCIRLSNAHVADLYERVPVGTTVTVI